MGVRDTGSVCAKHVYSTVNNECIACVHAYIHTLPGKVVGFCVGVVDGVFVGLCVVGAAEGCIVGVEVGDGVGTCVGERVRTGLLYA